MKQKYRETKLLKLKSELLMPYLTKHGDLGLQKVVDRLMSQQLGGVDNFKDWRVLLGLSWKT